MLKKYLIVAIVFIAILVTVFNCSVSNETITTTTIKSTTTTTTISRVVSKVYLSFEENPATSMTLSWIGNKVERYKIFYGTDSGNLTSMVDTTTSSMHHSIKLSTLLSDTKYYYQIVGYTDCSSDIKNFTTGLSSLTNYSFLCMGDSRAYSAGVSTLLDQISAKIIDTTSDFKFSVWTGDMIDWGSHSNLNLWYDWFDEAKSLTAYYPVLSAIGNHEYYAGYQIDGDGANFFNFMAFPTNDQGHEQWYSFDYGNSHHVVLNNAGDPVGVSDFTIGSLQYNFLVSDLNDASNDANIDWIFVYMHEPPYSSVTGKSNVSARTILTPVFDQYKVDIVFAGHAHNYERTVRIKDNTSDVTGTCYVVSGGAGAPLRSFDSTNWWTSFKAEEYHFCFISIDNKNLTLTATNFPGGAVIDTFTINK